MPAVMLRPGKYYVGNPTAVFSNWTPNPSLSYKSDKLDERNYPIWWHAFKYGESWVGAIPVEIIPAELLLPKVEEIEDDDKKKKVKKFEPLQFVTFAGETLFVEENGIGKIGDIDL